MSTQNFKQDDIFSMFNLVDDNAELKKNEEAARIEKEAKERDAKLAEIKKKTDTQNLEKTNKTKKKEAADEFSPNEDTIIRYFGESLPITTFFTDEELSEGLLVNIKDKEPTRKPLEAEMLRKRMEKEYPELVKSHTEIIFLKAKNIIVPTMKAKKKGSSEKVLSYDSTSLALPKIPFVVLRDFIAIAKLYGEANLEVHGDIYYCFDKEVYFLDIPRQIVNPLWVEIIEQSQTIVERVQDALKVVEIHSHHNMQAIPSSQDNESERVPRMHYAIVGRTDLYMPQVFLRQFISEEKGHLNKSITDLFASPFMELPTFDSSTIEVYES